MEIEKLVQEINNGKAKSAYLFYGPERYLTLRYATDVVDASLGDAIRDFNYDRFDGKGLDADRLVGIVRSLPMMADRRVVLIRHAEGMKPTAGAAIAGYLEDPSPSTVLVLEAAKVDMRKKPFARIRKSGGAIECKKLYPRNLPPWIQRMAREEGKKIDRHAVNALVQLVGADLARLESEVRKTSLFAGNDKTITAEHVSAVVADIRQESIFEFTDAVAGRNAEQALVILAKLTESGERALGILGMIWRHLRILMMAYDAIAGGAAPSQVFKTMGVPRFLYDKYQSQLRGFKGAQLRIACLRVRDVEFALKSSRIPERLLLENLVLGLCDGNGN